LRGWVLIPIRAEKPNLVSRRGVDAIAKENVVHLGVKVFESSVSGGKKKGNLVR